ncbi:MAG: hypothetical protein DWQ44_13445 [Bacteroidetes bacterium]|nr:MAG: hypothetical protein DWQ33_08255 [Bacteroidota bacterium]REK05732.1 MAG: hypothetical protein DWQ39_04800 [Bacteroidota bacterium]REK31962.1 MAG: hypothetical protein DWQ44_13445 [Bacteroidota bacterium]REK50027.1 MAG: hypothetical protein DWQ48_05670 [Bacteroidota bacterium]
MRSIEESVVTAMDGSDKELFPFLPYILQDLWGIGSDPKTILSLIKKHRNNYTDIKVLDWVAAKALCQSSYQKH